MKKLILTKERKQIEVSLDGEAFILTEMSGGVYAEYMKKQGTRFRFGPDGKPIGAPDVTNMHSDLIVRCMSDHKGTQVTIEYINGLPKEAVEALFDACQEINGLKENKDEKKQPPSLESTGHG